MECSMPRRREDEDALAFWSSALGVVIVGILAYCVWAGFAYIWEAIWGESVGQMLQDLKDPDPAKEINCTTFCFTCPAIAAVNKGLGIMAGLALNKDGRYCTCETGEYALPSRCDVNLPCKGNCTNTRMGGLLEYNEGWRSWLEKLFAVR